MFTVIGITRWSMYSGCIECCLYRLVVYELDSMQGKPILNGQLVVTVCKHKSGGGSENRRKKQKFQYVTISQRDSPNSFHL